MKISEQRKSRDFFMGSTYNCKDTGVYVAQGAKDIKILGNAHPAVKFN